MSLRTHLACALITATALSPVMATAQSPVQASVILRNGTIHTQDGADRTVQAVAILNDRIVAAGSDQSLMTLRGPNSCVVDLGGRAVVPGFADGHIHSKPEAFDESIVDLVPVRTMAELLARVKAGVDRAQPGELVVTNSDWHEAQLKELRLPTRWDLDTVAPNTPVIVIRGGHSYILNSAALTKFGITKDSVSPAGGSIGMDRARNDINGELVDRARDLSPIPPRPPKPLEERLRLLKQEQARYNELGLTSIRNPGTSIEAINDYWELTRRGEMTVRTSVMYRWDRRSSAADFKKQLETWPVKSGFGNEWLRLDGVKLGVDGGYEGGWMTQAYNEPYGHNGQFFGLNTVPRAQFIEVVRMLNEVDLRPSTHAVGDAAVELVLDAYEIANRDKPITDRRWAIEHAFITRGDQIPRVKALGAVISAQSHLYLAAASLKQYWGAERTARVAPVRSWLAAGIPVAGGTDNKLPYVPEAPLTTFYHWVTRDTVSAGVQGPDESITRKQALRIATLGNAYATFEEDIKGSLEPGKLADMVVLSHDILTGPERQLMQTKVLGTMVGGRFVYRAPELAGGCG
jgi:predicted amidohydrolase YtcJ